MKNLGGILIGGGAAILIGYLVYDKFFSAPATEDKDKDKGDVNGTPGTTPAPSSVPTSPSYAGKKVSEVILDTEPSKLKGLKVYAANDNTTIYTTLNNIYTKAKKGQLIGTYAGHSVSTVGGSMVNIKTTDPQNPYVKAADGQLKF